MISIGAHSARRFRAKTEQLKTLQGLLRQSQGQNLALTAAHVPLSLDSGRATLISKRGHACRAPGSGWYDISPEGDKFDTRSCQVPADIADS